MKTFLLINFAGTVLSPNTFIPDCSLAVLAGFLRQRGFNVFIVDAHLPARMRSLLESMPTAITEKIYQKQISSELIDEYQEARAKAEEHLVWEDDGEIWLEIKRLIENSQHNVTHIGFKLWVGGGIKRSIALAQKVKKHYPYLTSFAGGPALHYLRDLFPRYLQQEFAEEGPKIFDHLVYGDGEAYLSKILEAPDKMSSEFSFPDYGPDTYFGIEQMLPLRIIDDSRGCFNQCAFCSHPFFGGGMVRRRKVELIVDEMEWHYQQAGVQHFRFAGSNPPWGHVRAIAKAILRRHHLPIYYSIFSSMNNVHAEDFAELYRSGLRAIYFGIESADPEHARKVHNKDNGTIANIVRVCREAFAHNIFVCLSFIVPGPFESEKTKAANLHLLEQIFQTEEDKQKASIMVLPSFLGPGSLWWQKMEEYGLSFEEGLDKETYLLNMVDNNYDLFLPKKYLKKIGYRLHGRSIPQIFAECGDFALELQRRGMITDFDDAAYMVALSMNVDARSFKEQMMNFLINPVKEETQLVREIIYGQNSRNFGTQAQSAGSLVG